jgi:hypothetical protein
MLFFELKISQKHVISKKFQVFLGVLLTTKALVTLFLNALSSLNLLD